MAIKKLNIVTFTLLLFTSIAMANTNEFPGRDLYPEVNFIAISDLQASFTDVIVVDVRSAYEYETLRVKGAINIPLASGNFVSGMRKLRESTDKHIVVYCNGKTCMKSYKAVRKCIISDIKKVSAFDAGIMDWAKANPGRAELLGQTLKSPQQLISKDQFKKHLISPDEFGDRLAKSDAIVLDVRDRFQREGISLFVGREYRVYLDDKKRLDKFINKAKSKGKPLLIYDAAGKQVRWLQYYLQARGIKEFYFMKGGIRQYYKVMQEQDGGSSKS